MNQNHHQHMPWHNSNEETENINYYATGIQREPEYDYSYNSDDFGANNRFGWNYYHESTENNQDSSQIQPQSHVISSETIVSTTSKSHQNTNIKKRYKHLLLLLDGATYKSFRH